MYWIAHGNGRGRGTLIPAAFFRKEFTAAEPIARATLYITALGLFQSYVNGERFSEDQFTPGWSSYGKRLYYLTYDTRVIERQYTSMKRFMAHLVSRSRDYLLKAAETSYGDWKAVDGDTPDDLIATAFFAHDAKLMAEMAEATGRKADSAYSTALFELIRRSFIKAFVSDEGTIAGDTQTGYSLALSMELVSGPTLTRFSDRLADWIASNGWRLSTGYIGTRYLLPALSMSGKPEIAMRLLTNRGFPSWGFMLDNGATTLWERWDGDALRHGMRIPKIHL